MENNCTTWSNIPNDFEKINTETYKFLISEAKERHKSAIDESQSITNRVIDIIKICTPLAGISFGLIAKSNNIDNKNLHIVILLVLTLFITFNLYMILKPKSIIEVGQKPSESFIDYLDCDENDELEKEKSSYYNSLIKYEESINHMNKVNGSRMIYYRSLIISIPIYIMIAMYMSVASVI